MFVSATFVIALLLPTAVAPSRCESQQSGEFDHHYQKRMMSHGENLGELYYQHQLKERGRSLAYNSFIHLNPNYPCLHGVVPIGADTEESIMDGHKFACGIHHIKTGPIVYSFGSNQQQDFEMSMLQYRPDSIVFTHDILESHLPIPAERISNITYVASALGASSNKKDKTKYYLLHELMKERGHKYIDVLKIDIEGGEFVWLDNEPEETFSRIGQLMIEVHRSRSGVKIDYQKHKKFVEVLESRNFRIFHRELNFGKVDPCCMEFSFIRLDWSNWDSVVKFDLPAL